MSAQNPTAYEAVHGFLCHCGEERVHTWLYTETHRHSALGCVKLTELLPEERIDFNDSDDFEVTP